MTDVDDRPVSGSVSADISTAVVRLVRGYTGRGPTKSKTTIDRDLVTVLLADSLTKAEHSLVESGEADIVLATRHEFQRTMRDDLVAIVEGAMGRKVIAFMSTNHVEPDMAAEVFVLEPQGVDRTTEPEADSRP